MPDVTAPRSTMRLLRRLAAPLGVGVLMLSLAAANVSADSYDERRVRTGARLFRSMLAADTGLEKHLDGKGRLPVAVFADDPRRAKDVLPLIAPDDAAVRGMPLWVQARSALPADDEALAGVFLASRPSDAELDRLIRWSIAHGAIVYSPFEGDVERGIAGGLSIEAKVLPYVNAATLEAAGVELKPFFLKVAKVHP